MVPMARPALPSISTTHLSYLVAIVEAETWADAAARLGVTPSALSQGIAELERRLGWPLFERSGRKRVLADGGSEVVRWAESVLASTADLVEHLDQHRTGQVGHLRIGLIDTAMITTFAGTVAATQRQLGARLRVEVGTSTQLTRKVQAGDLDVAIVVDDNLALTTEFTGVAPLSARLLVREPLIALAPAEDESSYPAAWVLPPSGSTTRSIIDRELQAWRARHPPPLTTQPDEVIPAEVVMESHNPQVLQHMVAAGFGWTILPLGALGAGPGEPPEPRLRRSGVRWVTEFAGMERPLALVQRIGGPPNEAIDRFVDHCVASVQTG